MRSLAVLILAFGLLGCRERESAARLSSDSAAAGKLRRIGYDGYGRPAAVALNAVTVTSVEEQLPPVTQADISNMVIRTADVSIEVDSLEPAIAAVRQIAARLGGYVASSEITTGKAQLRDARLEMKVPAARFDESLVGLSPIGKLESVSRSLMVT